MVAPISLGIGDYLGIPYFDKVGHFVTWAVVTFSFTKVLTIRKSIFLAIVLSSVIEYMQYYVPNRTPSVGDAIANICGVLFIWLMFTTRDK